MLTTYINGKEIHIYYAHVSSLEKIDDLHFTFYMDSGKTYDITFSSYGIAKEVEETIFKFNQ